MRTEEEWQAEAIEALNTWRDWRRRQENIALDAGRQIDKFGVVEGSQFYNVWHYENDATYFVELQDIDAAYITCGYSTIDGAAQWAIEQAAENVQHRREMDERDAED